MTGMGIMAAGREDPWARIVAVEREGLRARTAAVKREGLQARTVAVRREDFPARSRIVTVPEKGLGKCGKNSRREAVISPT